MASPVARKNAPDPSELFPGSIALLGRGTEACIHVPPLKLRLHRVAQRPQ
jgi:hypothetical protein